MVILYCLQVNYQNGRVTYRCGPGTGFRDDEGEAVKFKVIKCPCLHQPNSDNNFIIQEGLECYGEYV